MRNLNAKKNDSACDNMVARAAPAMLILGKKPNPKMSRGSSMILVIVAIIRNLTGVLESPKFRRIWKDLAAKARSLTVRLMQSGNP